MVDAVFTWVNGNDPAHKRKRLRYQSETENKTSASDVYETARYADAGELWFALHLLRKNASWIRKIFLITDDQRPQWLTESKAITLGLTIIDHRTIFSGFENVLPTFNSRSIENMIFRIPGISNKVIYLNDDFFVINKTDYDDFFQSDKIKVRGQWGFKNKWLDRFLRLLKPKTFKGLVGRRPGMNRLPFSFRYFSIAHAPQPLLLDKMEKFFSDSELLKHNISYRFRSHEQISPIGFVINYCLAHGDAVENCNNDWAYLSSEEDNEKHLVKSLQKIRKNRKKKFLCVQSLAIAGDETKEEVKKELAFLLNDGEQDSFT